MLAAAVVAGAFVYSAHPVAADAGVHLAAQVGLDGVSRQGRWTPVRVQIQNDTDDISGELLIEWGDARLHRDLRIPAPSRHEFEFYVRTTDIRDVVDITLTSNGRAIGRVEAPVRIAPDDESLAVCIGSTQPSGNRACSVTLSTAALPRSVRGLDAADEIRLDSAFESGLAPEQRSAVRRWRDYHALEAANLLTLAPHAVWSNARSTTLPSSLVVTCAIEFGCLLLAAVYWLRRQASPARSYVVLAGAMLVATAGSAVAGRVGPGASMLFRHASTVQQFADGSRISVKGSIEYPAFDHYTVWVDSDDAAMTSKRGNPTEAWLDRDGRTTLRSIRGRGELEEVTIEASSSMAPFAVTTVGTTVRVSNLTRSPLTDCRFPEGFSRADAGTLQPGASVEAQSLKPVEEAF
ncbi:MAG: hypothetical protein ABL982_23455, partial [Vicinamibacterales bacterium]